MILLLYFQTSTEGKFSVNSSCALEAVYLKVIEHSRLGGCNRSSQIERGSVCVTESVITGLTTVRD